MIVSTEEQISSVANFQDRRELRNFQRFLRLWPTHGFDMLDRPRWQKYLGVTKPEAEALKKNPPFCKPVSAKEVR